MPALPAAFVLCTTVLAPIFCLLTLHVFLKHGATFFAVHLVISTPVFPFQNVEALDPRGRTLLHLAVSLGHLESARVLLRHKADVTKENGQGWTGKFPFKRI